MQAMGALLKNKDNLQDAAARVRQATADLRAEGSAGAGAVRVTASGDGRILDVRLDPTFAASLADGTARDAASRLLADAVNDALAQARQRVQALVRAEAKSMGIPEVDQFLEKAISSGGLGL
jgi:DNA-binding protein YbaB